MLRERHTSGRFNPFPGSLVVAPLFCHTLHEIMLRRLKAAAIAQTEGNFFFPGL
jgi:hypothetical protein